MKSVSELRVQIFGDGADKNAILELYRQPYIKGFTTNPTLMRRAGVTDYQGFALDILKHITDRPISFEVFAEDEKLMERQARHIAKWGKNVFVKIPITNTRGESMLKLARRLSSEGIQVNVTALLTLDQVSSACKVLKGGARSYVSVFAGRIADTGRDPIPMMREAVAMVNEIGTAHLIWASPRELLNIFQAEEVGCHVITATSDVLAKLGLIGKDLEQFSLETVEMFHRDARNSGYALPLEPADDSEVISRRVEIPTVVRS
jgi:transaldolase